MREWTGDPAIGGPASPERDAGYGSTFAKAVLRRVNRIVGLFPRHARCWLVRELAVLDQETHDPSMDDERISRLEGFVDGFRAMPQLAMTTVSIVLGVLAIVLTVGIFALNNMSGQIRDMNSQIRDIGAKVDALPNQLTEEFRAMRAETSAQTSAIASSITAARQFQPQVFVVPAPASSAQTSKP